MSKRGLGFVLVLAFAVAAGALVQDFRFDASIARERLATDILNRTLDSTQLSLANLRAAQAGYLAAGQGPDFWMKRATDLSAEIESTLTSLQSATTSADARSHYDAAIPALGNLNGIDQKARDDIASGERFLASDLLFMDATTAAQQLGNEVSAGRDAEYAAGDARVTALRRSRLALDGAAVALLLVVALILAVRRPAVRVVDAPAVEALVSKPADPAPLADRIVANGVSLADAAQVCVDLARVLDGRDVPPLLERAARVLEAKGLVLWVADDSGAMLRPSLAHGYSPMVLQRMGPLQVDADNVTSLAFRSMQAQVLNGPSHGASGALAVPLITPTGCIGVLSAEVSGARNGSDTLSVARMFAAQLATLVGPVSESTSPKVAQA